jgi:hypothetical protein
MESRATTWVIGPRDTVYILKKKTLGKNQGTQRSLNRQISGEAAMVQAVVVCARGSGESGESGVDGVE